MYGQRHPFPPASTWRHSDGIRNLDIDLEDRNFIATVHLHANAVRINFDVPADDGQNFFTQDNEKIRGASRGAFISEQYLQAVARHRGGASPFE